MSVTTSPVLHLYANHKVTGPAELALESARGLRDLGEEVQFFSSAPTQTRHRDRWLHQLANERAIPTAALSGVVLPKHISPWRAFLDIRRLSRHLSQDPPRLIHCHLPADHLVAGYALKRSRLHLPLVRSLYDGTPPPPSLRLRLTWGRMTSLLLCHSEQVAAWICQRERDYRLDPARVRTLSPPIDVHRFDPQRVNPSRSALGIPADAFCAGIVARMQTHRRYEILLQAVGRVREEVPEFHLVVVGRGTNQERVAKAPAEEMGLGKCIHFPGYISGDDYVSALASFDAKIFLVPGSDGTCRAVREALSMGLPTVCTRRGILPELVRDGKDGYLVDENAESLATALIKLAKSAELRKQMSEAARAGAVERFSFERYAARLRDLYEEAEPLAF